MSQDRSVPILPWISASSNSDSLHSFRSAPCEWYMHLLAADLTNQYQLGRCLQIHLFDAHWFPHQSPLHSPSHQCFPMSTVCMQDPAHGAKGHESSNSSPWAGGSCDNRHLLHRKYQMEAHSVSPLLSYLHCLCSRGHQEHNWLDNLA